MFEPIDAYCERTSAAYWAEPVNAVTNLAFLIAAVVMWRRTQGLPFARAMCVVLGVIGVGSYLFHTHANRLTALMDVLPILGFILLYLFAATRDLLGMRGWWPWIAVAGFFPYAIGAGAALGAVLPLGSSAAYAPIPPLILAYAWAVGRAVPRTGRGLALGAMILIVSLTFRTLDGPLCDVLPSGTHFLWHVLNGVMLGWMIEVYRQHRLAADGARG
ncbi:MAG: ceramidase domain-containing protein [Paracoccaceae bacterium]